MDESLRQRVEQYRQQQAMSGQTPIEEYVDGDADTYLQRLAGSNPEAVSMLTGLSTTVDNELPELMRRGEASGAYERAPPSGIGKVFEAVGTVGRTFEDNPALFFGLPFAVAALGGAFGAGAGGGGGGGAAAAAADGLAPITTGASTLPGGVAAVDAAATAGLAGTAPLAALPPAIATPAAVSAFTGAAAAPAVAGAASTAAPAASTAAQTAAAQDMTAVIQGGAQSGGFFRRVGDFLSRNQDIIGSVLVGYGQAQAEQDLLRERQDLISANYRGTDPGRTYSGMKPGTSTQKPWERFGAAKIGGPGLVYDAAQRRMVRELMPAGGG